MYGNREFGGEPGSLLLYIIKACEVAFVGDDLFRQHWNHFQNRLKQAKTLINGTLKAGQTACGFCRNKLILTNLFKSCPKLNSFETAQKVLNSLFMLALLCHGAPPPSHHPSCTACPPQCTDCAPRPETPPRCSTSVPTWPGESTRKVFVWLIPRKPSINWVSRKRRFPLYSYGLQIMTVCWTVHSWTLWCLEIC